MEWIVIIKEVLIHHVYIEAETREEAREAVCEVPEEELQYQSSRVQSCYTIGAIRKDI